MEHFSYHSFAVGLTADIQKPFCEQLPVRASVALPEAGGFGSSRAEHIRFRHILSADSVTAVVAGSYSERDGTFDSIGTVTIENLDVLGMVRAGRIVARIAASHPREGGPASIIPLGSYFENLVIAGFPVNVDLATGTFTKLDTADKVREAHLREEGFREEFKKLSWLNKRESVPERLQRFLPWCGKQEVDLSSEHSREIHTSLVRDIKGLPRGTECHGHTILLPGFGVIRLAEFTITNSARRLTMLQIHLGSSPEGAISSGGVEGNGSGW